MEILVIGAGSIGRRHISNLNSLGITTITVVDIDKSRLDYINNNYKVAETKQDIDKVLKKKFNAAFILTPPSLHIEFAKRLAEMKTDIFIEKPLSVSLDGVDELIDIVEKNNLVAAVGYNQRFNKAVVQVKGLLEELGNIYYARAEFGQYLPDWRPWQDYRNSYTSRKDLGGGILLDASHEIDYILYLLDEKISSVSGYAKKISNLDTNVEDLVEILLEFESGIVASIHLDMIEHGYSRSLKVIGEKGTVKYDFFKNELIHFDGSKRRTTVFDMDEFDINNTYMDEVKDFIKCVEDRREPFVNLYEAKKNIRDHRMCKEMKNG